MTDGGQPHSVTPDDMRFGDQFVRAPMPGATHIRIVKRRVDPRSTSSKLSHWVGDAVSGSEGPSADQPAALQITALEWAAPDGRTVSVPVADVAVTDHDIGVVLAYGRRYHIGVSVWSQSAALDSAMRLEQSWFPVPAPDDRHPDVSVTWGTPGCVEVMMGRDRGSFDKTLGALRRRSVTNERWAASLDRERLVVEYQPPSDHRWTQTWRRSDVVAIGNGVRPGSGTVVFASDGATTVPRISQRGPTGDALRRMRTAVHALNAALA